MEKYVVSIILLSFNNLQFLYQSIDSVLMQNYPLIELIVSDDATKGFPKTEVLEYIETRKNDNLKAAIVQTNPENVGTVKNLNGAIGLAQGDVIKVMGADDQFYNEGVVEKIVDYFQSAKDAQLVATNVLVCDERMRETGKFVKYGFQRYLTKQDSENRFARLCKRNYIPAPGVFFRRSYFERYGPFDERYRLLEDWPAWLRVMREGGRIEFLDMITVKYRKGIGVGTSTNRTYLADKKLCFKLEIEPYRMQIGKMNYLISRLYAIVFSSILLRRIYNILFRKQFS